MGVDKTYDLIRKSYVWPRLYKEVIEYVNSCFVSQTQSRAQEATPLMETDLANYPFQKASMDISSPYVATPRGNKYILSFVDWLTN